jgi:Na+-driven multidrug efflux pump
MGVTGAAVATIIGQAFASLYAFYYYRSGRTLITPKLKYLRPKLETYKQIFYIGIPSSLSQITLAIGNTVAYNMASRFGDAHVAAIGVAGRVFSIATFVFIGTSVGTQALIGFNYGARNYTRMKRVMRTAMTMTLSYGAVLTLIFALLPETLISIFIKDPEVKVYGALTLQAYVFAIPTASVGMILMSSLQAMGKALQAFLVAISRQGVIYIPLLHILTHFFGFQGLVLAMPASDFLTTSMSFIFVLNIVRKLKHTQTVDFDPAKLETSDLLGT